MEYDKETQRAMAEANAKEAIMRQSGLAREYNPHEIKDSRAFIPSDEFDPAEYEVRRSGKRHTDYINIMYAPKGSPLGTQHTVPKWLADAFEQMLKDYPTNKSETDNG